MTTCAVIGSARGARLPHRTCDHYAYANGSVVVGHRSPSTWYTTALFCKLHPPTIVQQSKQFHHTRVFVDVKDGLDVSGLINTTDVLITITPEQRDAIVYQSCKLHLGAGSVSNRVSTGIYAICASLLEFDNVIVCGVSLAPEYIPQYGNQLSIRGHMPADEQCLQALATRHNKRLLTTSVEMSRRFSFRMVA